MTTTSATDPSVQSSGHETHKRRLPRPGDAAKGQILWNYAVPIVAVHLLACLVFVPWFFSWTGVVTWLVSHYLLGMLGVTLCYHRLLSHRSFATPLWVERVLAVLALWTLEDTPARWVATHRMHHTHSDEPEDPHTPWSGFWWSHVGWLLIRNSALHHFGILQKYARDILDDPFYMRLERTPWLRVGIYLTQFPFFFGLGALLAWWGGADRAEIWRLAWSVTVWGMFLRTVTVWHVTWSVNSLTHTFGYQNFATGDDSRNNWLVGWVAAGEGWHNNHHHDPASATVQIRWWEVDTTYYTILALKACGLAWNVVPPRHRRREGREATTASRST